MPDIKNMTAKFAKTRLYNNRHQWGIQEFCTHYECTTDDLERQFHRLWKTERSFHEMWNMLEKNTARSVKMAKNKRRRQDVTASKMMATEEIEQPMVDDSSSPTLCDTVEHQIELLRKKEANIRALLIELKQAYNDDKVSMEHLTQKMLDDANRGVDLAINLDELQKEISRLEQQRTVVHVRKGGYIDIDRKAIGWNPTEIDLISFTTVPTRLIGFDYGGAKDCDIVEVHKAVARCIWVEKKYAELGKEVEFDFVDTLSARAYEYARNACSAV